MKESSINLQSTHVNWSSEWKFTENTNQKGCKGNCLKDYTVRTEIRLMND